MSELDPNATVTVERDGRTFSGTGVTEESLEATMDRHAPVEEAASPAPVPAGTVSPAPEAQPQPKPTRGQARFSELTQKAKDAEAKALAAEARAAAAEARLAQPSTQHNNSQPSQIPLQAGPAQPPARQPQLEPHAPVFTRPEPTEDDIGEGKKYETYAAFTKDQAQWVWEQQQSSIEQRIRQGIDADRAQQAFASHVERTRTKGRTAYADFDAMLTNGPGTFVNMPLQAVHAILQAPNSEHLQYAIMRDGALAQKLAGLAFQDPYAFAVELARLAPATPAATSASTGTPGSSTPPPPMQPVGSGSQTTTLTSREHAEKGDYQAYKAARTAERSRGRR